MTDETSLFLFTQLIVHYQGIILIAIAILLFAGVMLDLPKHIFNYVKEKKQSLKFEENVTDAVQQQYVDGKSRQNNKKGKKQKRNENSFK